MKLERLPDEERIGKDILSPTSLITLFKSPKHFYSYHVLNERKPSKAMEAGRIIHKAVLEPDTFAESYAVIDDKEKYICTVEDLKKEITLAGAKPISGNKSDFINQLKEIKPDAKIWDLYISEIEKSGKEIVTQDQWRSCQRIIEEINKHPWLSKAISGGHKEQPAWFEHETGVHITMRMDYYHPAMGAQKRPVVIDLKKVNNSEPRYFSKQIFDNGLYIQAAVYVDCIKKITGVEPLYAWACVEDSPPYSVEVYAADFGMLEAGRAVYNKMIIKYLECKASNKWPGYSNGNVINVSLPSWAFDRLDAYAEDELQGE